MAYFLNNNSYNNRSNFACAGCIYSHIISSLAIYLNPCFYRQQSLKNAQLWIDMIELIKGRPEGLQGRVITYSTLPKNVVIARVSSDYDTLTVNESHEPAVFSAYATTDL